MSDESEDTLCTSSSVGGRVIHSRGRGLGGRRTGGNIAGHIDRDVSFCHILSNYVIQ